MRSIRKTSLVGDRASGLGTKNVAYEHGPDVAGLLVSEHDGMRLDLDDLLGQRSPSVRRAAFEALARRLVRHDAAEQQVVYPVLVHDEDGRDLREVLQRQERDLAVHLKLLLRRLLWRPDGQKTRQRLEEFKSAFEHHLWLEEHSLVPLLLVDEDENKRQMMGSWVQLAEQHAPTRPHPHGPRLPGLLTVGVALAVIDRFRGLARPSLHRAD